MPRIQNSEVSFPGSPEVCMAITPATLPANVLLMLILPPPACFNVFTLTVVMAPVTVAFFCIPVPVTVTSSNTFFSLGVI